MDKELIDLITEAKFEGKILASLIDVILTNCRLDYSGNGLKVEEDRDVMSIVKAFYGDDYNNRLNELKEEAVKNG